MTTWYESTQGKSEVSAAAGTFLRVGGPSLSHKLTFGNSALVSAIQAASLALALSALGLGTSDTPQFSALNIGGTSHTLDVSGGRLRVEGSNILLASDIGTSVQASSASLSAIAALATTDGNIIVGDGATWVAESGATARASLGLTIGTHVQAFDAGLSALAAFNTNGLLVQTADNVFAGRTLAGTSNEISVANGDGVSANPTISLPSALTFTGKAVTGGTFASPTLSGTVAGSFSVSGVITSVYAVQGGFGWQPAGDNQVGMNFYEQSSDGGTVRWALGQDASSNGYHFFLNRYDSSGNFVERPFQIDASSGVVTFSDVATMGGNTVLTTATGAQLASSPTFLDTNCIVSSQGTGGYGAFFARGSGTNSGYIFFGNVSNGERARIWGDDSRNLIFSTDGGNTNTVIDSAGNWVIPASLQARVATSSETSGTLTSASANKQVLCSGNITLPSSGMTDGDIILIDPRGSARTITRPGSHTMYISNTDSATGTTGAHNLVVAKYHGSSKWTVSGNVA